MDGDLIFANATERAIREGHRWLFGSAAFVGFSFVLYATWRPAWEALRTVLLGSEWFCMAKWFNRRGFVQGLRTHAEVDRD